MLTAVLGVHGVKAGVFVLSAVHAVVQGVDAPVHPPGRQCCRVSSSPCGPSWPANSPCLRQGVTNVLTLATDCPLRLTSLPNRRATIAATGGLWFVCDPFAIAHLAVMLEFLLGPSSGFEEMLFGLSKWDWLSCGHCHSEHLVTTYYILFDLTNIGSILFPCQGCLSEHLLDGGQFSLHSC